MLIAIAGSQGSGKTTVLNALKSRGFEVIERKTARSILSDWGISLDAVNADFALKKAFQEELIKRKHSDEVESSLSDDIVFTERTFSDLFTYSLISFGQYNKYDTWLDEYFNKCKTLCQHYGHVFYIKSVFSDNIENDGVRSVNRHYSKMIDKIMLDITHQMIDNKRLSVIETDDLNERVNLILNKIEELSHENAN